jgi:hypothetical protein
MCTATIVNANPRSPEGVDPSNDAKSRRRIAKATTAASRLVGFLLELWFAVVRQTMAVSGLVAVHTGILDDPEQYTPQTNIDTAMHHRGI